MIKQTIRTPLQNKMLLIVEYLLDFPNNHPRLTFFAFFLFEILFNTILIIHYSSNTEPKFSSYISRSLEFFEIKKFDSNTAQGIMACNALEMLNHFGVIDGVIYIRIAFMVIYIITWVTVYIIYFKAKTPFFYLPLLTISKCLRSIYLSNLSDESIPMLLLCIAILALLNQRYKLATLLFSAAISIRTNALTFLPAWILILTVHLGLLNAIFHILFIKSMYFVSSLIISNNLSFESISYDSTVNWAFIPNNFSIYTISISTYIIILSIFFAFWSKVSGGTRLFLIRSIMYPKDPHPNSYNTEDQLTILFSCNLIGILCIPCLYSFYPWYFHTIPFLMYKSNLFLPLQYIIFFTIEICWCIAPPTVFSSLCILSIHIILLIGLIRYHYFALWVYRMHPSSEG